MLRFDIDGRQITSLIFELGLTERQAKAALNRALRRTAATLRRRAERALKSELDVRKVAYLRRRLKDIRLSRGGFEGIKLWFGENPMYVSALRGKVGKSGTGASFSGKAGSKEFPGGFVVKGKFGRTIMVRKGAERLPIAEASVPVQDKMNALIEGHLFADTLALVWMYFERDMNARAKHGVGVGRGR